jgi:hypothetical protein
MNMPLRIALTAAFAAFALTGAAANPLEDELARASNTCWERSYDAAHMKAHPKQLVAKIRLSTEVQDDGSIVAQLGFNLRKRNGVGGAHDYAAFGICKAKGEGITCPSEWDAGTFSITKGKGGALLVSNRHMIVNPSNYDSEDIAPGAVDRGKSDDAVWMVTRIKDEGCDIY